MPGDDSSPPSEDVDEVYEWIVDNHPRWRETKRQIKRELLGEAPGSEDEIQTRIREAINTHEDHDELLQSTISAFDPRGEICRETGWRVLASEPVSEKNVPNADALIGHLDQEWAILVECKTGLSRPGQSLEQLYDAAAEVRDHRDYLEEKTGLTIENIDCVLCIPSELDWRATNTIEEYEENGDAREPVYVWRLSRFSGETLQLHEDIDTREPGEASHDHALTQMLSNEGVRISGESEVTPTFFPSSHLANVIEVAFSEVLWNRERDEEPVTKFNRQELTEVLTSTDNLLHYSAGTIGERIRDEVLSCLYDYELIEPYTGDGEDTTETEVDSVDEVDVFEYGVDGRTTETLLANLTSEYFECEVDTTAEFEARKRVVDQFRNESGSLSDFNDE